MRVRGDISESLPMVMPSQRSEPESNSAVLSGVLAPIWALSRPPVTSRLWVSVYSTLPPVGASYRVKVTESEAADSGLPPESSRRAW